MNQIDRFKKVAFSKSLSAQEYAALGWAVIPLEEKRPCVRWQELRRLPGETLAVLFDEPTTLNLGIRLGKISDLVAIDIDGPAGFEAFNKFTADIEWPDTWQFETPAGYRYLFKWTPVPTRSTRSDKKELWRIMSDGTQTVAPPSTLSTGRYQWTRGTALHHLPEKFLAKISQYERPVATDKIDLAPTTAQHTPDERYRRARGYLKKCEPAISGQNGHSRTFKIAVKLIHAFGLTYHQTFALLWNDFNPYCQPPWSEEEIAHKIEDAMKAEKIPGSYL